MEDGISGIFGGCLHCELLLNTLDLNLDESKDTLVSIDEYIKGLINEKEHFGNDYYKKINNINDIMKKIIDTQEKSKKEGILKTLIKLFEDFSDFMYETYY